MYLGTSGVAMTVPATAPAMPPPVTRKTDATSCDSRSLPIAAATAPAPSRPPIKPDATSSSERPDRCTYVSRTFASPV